MNERKQQLKEFLKEYEALCNKYNLLVSACGCCDSPYLVCLEYENKDTIKEKVTESIKNEIKDSINHLLEIDYSFLKNNDS